MIHGETLSCEGGGGKKDHRALYGEAHDYETSHRMCFPIANSRIRASVPDIASTSLLMQDKALGAIGEAGETRVELFAIARCQKSSWRSFPAVGIQ